MSDYQAIRRFRRFPARHTAILRTIGADVEGFARTNTVSVGGCGVVTDEAVDSGVAVELLLTMAGRIVQIFGRTVYSRELDYGNAEVGVEFLDILPEDAVLIETLHGNGHARQASA